MASLRIAAFALALLGTTFVVGQASAAMPVTGLENAAKQMKNIQDVRWGYRRGWGWRAGWAWRGRYWGPGWRGYYGPGPYWGYGCGWRRCWW